MEGSGGRITLPVDVELRDLAPGVEETFCIGALLPDDLASGEYRVGLWMPDAAPTLRGDERYAVRLVNDVEWTGGVNFFSAMVSVE